MTTRREELEARLRAVLREQAESVPVSTPSWAEAQAVRDGSSRLLRAPVLALGVAALVVVVLAVVLAGRSGQPERVMTGPAASGEAPSPVPTTTTSAVAPAPFHVETRQVSLSADAVRIDTAGRRFVTAPPIDVRGDPGIPDEYTSLELTWQEHGVEMRLFIYLNSDGREWWSNEIRTYNGSPQGDWITYTGEFFRRPLGTPFVGDLTVATPDPALGRLHVANMRLEAFRRPPACDAAAGAFVLEPGTSPIVMEGFVGGYGASVRLLSTASCSPVADENRYRYEWETRDPSVVTVERFVVVPEVGERRADLKPAGKGRTTVHVTARDPETGAIVAETDLEVVVGEVKALPAPTVVPAPTVP